MTDNLTIPDQPVETEVSNSSTSMLITMLLLIGGLLMTAVTLINHTNSNHKEVDGDNKSFFDFSFLSQPKDTPATAGKNEKTTPTISDGISNLLGMGEPGKVRWPKLRLYGFGSSNDESGDFAIINNKKFHPGQLIDGKAMLVEIRRNDVIVEYKSEQRILTMQN